MMGADEYLAIPEAYSRWLGGLRWGEDGDVIEYTADDREIGLTFAMSAEVAMMLLGGMADARRAPHFAFVLHFLHLLGFGGRYHATGTPPRVPVHDHLSRAFREAGRTIALRNSGVLCAVVCRDMPGVADPPDPWKVQERLRSRVPGGFRGLARLAVEEPPLPPEAFDAKIRERLRQFSLDDLRHWMRHGRGPIPNAGEEAARLVSIPLAQALTSIETRPRLQGIAGLVPHLNGALTLPPRSLSHADLPLGGYTDVTNRGEPEQILPSQLALDPDEFLRRFASRELLYYHREEPHAPTARELVLVIDQGVRTWGDVRLVLAAAAVALARKGDRNELAIRLATTGNGGEPVDVAGLDVEALGTLLESSDLTPNPAPALARAVASGTEPRDLILLTHPRNLAEPEVTAAASAIPDDDRLFAVSVDAGGEVALSEIRPSGPVAVGRCRVHLADLHAKPEVVAPEQITPDEPSWSGDVEAIGFPFSIGALAPFSDSHFDFDESGDWLLLAGRRGLLHAWRTDGSASEMLPRAAHSGQVLDNVAAVIGVAGGFIVRGTAGKLSIVAHYDWVTRVCKVFDLSWTEVDRIHWFYARQFHTLLGFFDDRPAFGLELGSKPPTPVARPRHPNTRRASPLAQWVEREFGAHSWDASDWCGAEPLSHLQSVSIERETGEVVLLIRDGKQVPHVPLSENRPRLAGAYLLKWRWREGILALLVAFAGGRRSVQVFEAPGSWRFVAEYVCPRDASDFALSRDGRRIAWRANSRQLVIRVVGEVGPPPLTTPKGQTHPGLGLALGHRFLTIHAGKHSHLVRWDRGRLEFAQTDADVDALVQRTFGKLPPRITAGNHFNRQDIPNTEVHRFSKCASNSELTSLVDHFGQVVILDRRGNLVCMFLVFRNQIAVWAPDGSRIGPVSMLGRPPTPGAEVQIATALVHAGEGRKYPTP